MTHYRTVKASERLPEEEGEYLCLHKTALGHKQYATLCFERGQFFAPVGKFSIASFAREKERIEWLEPYEPKKPIATAKDIERAKFSISKILHPSGIWSIEQGFVMEWVAKAALRAMGYRIEGEAE